MGELLLRFGLMLILAAGCLVTVQADSHQSRGDPELPSAEMLEFLGDLEPVDEETWRLLEHHALKDVAENKEVNSE